VYFVCPISVLQNYEFAGPRLAGEMNPSGGHLKTMIKLRASPIWPPIVIACPAMSAP
jgi:hypothetical protein